MPYHTNSKDVPKGFHRMPDGSLMKGEKHQEPELIPTEELKEGGLRRQLRLKKDEKFKIGELVQANKTKVGDMFQFRGKPFKMTPLMKKRITLGINLLRIGRKKK